jgi:hypothetical protein
LTVFETYSVTFCIYRKTLRKSRNVGKKSISSSNEENLEIAFSFGKLYIEKGIEEKVREPMESEKTAPGFVKTVAPQAGQLTKPIALDSAQKSALNRRGNELFNKGQIEGAKRIFLTTGYSDGIIRVADRYQKEGRAAEALILYWRAPDRKKAATLIEKMAFLIHNILEEDGENDRPV